jgi:hypothetical protein
VSSPPSAPVADSPETSSHGTLDQAATSVDSAIAHEDNHYLRGGLAGAALGSAAYAMIASGLISGVAALGLALAALVLSPTTPRLASRVAVNGSIVMGWLPLLWWVPWPFDVNHAGLALAVVVAALTAYVASGERPRRRAYQLLPAISSSDVLLPAAAATALVAVHNLAFAETPRQALKILLPGADNWVHFDIFSTMRAHGSVLSVADSASDGSGWAYEDYPSHFHAWVATLTELLAPTLPRGPEGLVAYAHGVAVLVALGTVVMTAAVLSLPRVSDRLGVATPAVVLVWAAFLWEPGQKILANGFASFWMAAMAAGSALVIAFAPGRSRTLPCALAVAGLLVTIAHTWTPMLVVASPAALLMLVPTRGTPRRDDRRRLWVVLVVFGLAGSAMLKAAIVLVTTVDVDELVTAFGGLDGTSPLPTFLLILVSLFLCCSARSWLSRRGVEADFQSAWRLRLLAAAPILGVTAGGVIFAAQLRTLGTTSYYFLKYFMGLELVLTVLVAGLGATLVAHVAVRRTGPLRVAMSVVATLAASQSFGWVPGHTGLLLSGTDDGTASVAAPYARTPMADGIIRAVGDHSSSPSFTKDYLGVGSGRAAESFYTDGWFHAIDASLTSEVMDRVNLLRVPADDTQQIASALDTLLAHDPRVSVIVDPRHLSRVRGVVGPRHDTSRVVAWPRTSRGGFRAE